MKILSNLPINNSSVYNAQKSEKKVQNTQNNVSVPILNNSLSEAIGRSQVVSFCGENKIEGSTFSHKCSEMFGDREDISYNKNDGSFIHSVYSKNGELKKQEEFYPMIGREVITKVREGIKTVISKTASSVTVEKTDSTGEQIYFDYSSTDGNKKTVTTDFDKNRRIIMTEHNGISNIQVIDLKTGLPVTEGDIVLRRYLDDKSGSYITENIITGKLVKVEKYRPNNKLSSLIEYSQETGRILRNLQYDERTGGYVDCMYRESGTREALIKTSKNGRIIDGYKFANDGKTETEHVVSEYGKNKDLQSETVYIPGTDKISTYTEFEENGCKTYFYGKVNNVPKYAERYIDGRLVEKFNFYQDGEIVKQSVKYNKNGSTEETFYDRSGMKQSSKKTDPDGFVYRYCEYNPSTETVRRVINIDKYTNDIKETIYNDYTGAVKRIKLTSADGTVKEDTIFYQDGQTPKSKKVYHEDGSFTYTKYDEDGYSTGSSEYNADGSKKTNDYNYSYFHGANRSSNNTQPKRELSKKEFLEKFLHDFSYINSYAGYEISDADWIQLSEYLGVDNKDVLVYMDKQTYRQLSKKFHPDLQTNKSKEDLDMYETIFKIITALYTSAQALHY